jgi:hypothetical protein
VTREDAISRLERSCLQDREGRCFFSCKSGVVVVRLHGVADPLQFLGRNHFAFRIGPEFFHIERRETGAAVQIFKWAEIETLAAGEPEMAGGALFQG